MQKGRVIIAGSGPGDPDLITVKAAKYLGMADIILADRLVSGEILSRYARPGATCVFVGKEGYATASVSQKSINELLVAYSSAGHLVVRLKGGDVAFFANVLDEIETLRAHDIPFEIIPGITAASGASAYAGIPLTARGYADSVRFITAFGKEAHPESYWKDLAGTDDTLVCYMSGALLPLLINKLKDHPVSSEKRIAIIEQATTPQQRVRSFSFSETETLPGHSLVSPVLIVIGRVVHLFRGTDREDPGTIPERYFSNAAELQAINQNKKSHN